MLALTRKPGDFVMIGDNIMVRLVKINGLLKFVIDAPKEIPITRGELYLKQLQEAKKSGVN